MQIIYYGACYSGRGPESVAGSRVSIMHPGFYWLVVCQWTGETLWAIATSTTTTQLSDSRTGHQLIKVITVCHSLTQ